MMQLLAQGVPLTLILDLVEPPDAAELYAVEGGRRFEWYQQSAAGGQRLNREPIRLP